MNQKPKTKYVMKAQIKLHPTIKEPIDKGTKTLSKILVGVLIVCLIWLLMEVMIFPPRATIKPSQQEINKYCEERNMIPYGYTIEYNEKKVFWFITKRTEEQAYITCKAEYPKKITETPEQTIPECCYPPECPQSENNPKYCNCIYLTHCIKTSNTEYKQWNYKIKGQ